MIIFEEIQVPYITKLSLPKETTRKELSKTKYGAHTMRETKNFKSTISHEFMHKKKAISQFYQYKEIYKAEEYKNLKELYIKKVIKSNS